METEQNDTIETADFINLGQEFQGSYHQRMIRMFISSVLMVLVALTSVWMFLMCVQVL